MYSRRRRGSFHAKPTNHCRVAICDDRTPCVGFLARSCSRWREYLNAVGIFLFYSSSFSSLCTDPNLHHEDEVEARGGRNNIICGEHEIPSFGPCQVVSGLSRSLHSKLHLHLPVPWFSLNPPCACGEINGIPWAPPGLATNSWLLLLLLHLLPRALRLWI